MAQTRYQAFRRTGMFLLVLTALGGACLGAWQRQSLWTRFCVRQLARSNSGNCEQWAVRCAQCDERDFPILLQGLRDNREQACTQLSAALRMRLDIQAHKNPGELAQDLKEIAADLATFSEAGQCHCLQLLHELLGGSSGRCMTPEARSVIQAALGSLTDNTSSAVCAKGLKVANDLAETAAPGFADSIAGFLRRALLDRQADNRIAAIGLAARWAPQSLDGATKLLDDPCPQVRQAAVLALGDHPDIVRTDDLLHLLHDSDEQVRSYSELALRSRGIEDEQLKVAWLLTDPQPQQRLKVFSILESRSDLSPLVWLEKLSEDPSPAVRAAAIRMIGEKLPKDSQRRFAAVWQRETSPTVQQMAEYYLSCQVR